MSLMKYDATTIGNHDFDAGLENLANQLTKHASFPMLICNYDFTGTPMEYKYEPYKIFKKGKLKIGVFGVGIALKGLVPENLAAGTIYLDPVQQANQVANLLRIEKKCDFIICLSHLGYQYRENTISDVLLAEQSENIDLIIGGHTHTFLNAPVTSKNKLGKDVVINQVGFSGIILGRLDFDFSKISRKNLINSSAISIIKKTG
jgi:5'-nucleotidase